MTEQNKTEATENLILDSKTSNESKTKTKKKSNENLGLDNQTLDMLKRVRDRKLVSGGKDAFYVPEKDKKSNFCYQWASTDKDTAESISSLEEIGWRRVEGYRTIPTGGYTVNGQPGEHILMSIQKVIYDELLKIQHELNEKKKQSVFGSELTMKDGKSKMASKTEVDDTDFLN